MPLPHLSIIIRPLSVTAPITPRLPLKEASGFLQLIRLASEKITAAIKCTSRAIKMALFMPIRATREDGAVGFNRDNAAAAHRIGSQQRQRVEMAINPSPRAARLMPVAFADAMAPDNSGEGACGTAPASGHAVPQFSLRRDYCALHPSKQAACVTFGRKTRGGDMEDRYR